MGKQLLKVVLIGDGGVGKTSLRNQFIHKRFTNAYKATIGADFITKEIELEDGKRVSLQIWDTAGQERFQSLGIAFYRGADACVLCYDVTNYLTFEHLARWRREFLNQAGIGDSNPDFPFVLLGNKIDIDERVVSRRQARGFAQEHSTVTGSKVEMPCFEASAKDGIHVEDAFLYIAKSVRIPQMELDMVGGGSAPGSSQRLDWDAESEARKKSKGCC
ncbi:Ras- protein Rab-7 [Mortierella sp. 14UC]|nr:Ras- protein Rab-7 [Mortierella sp. 14UC]